MIKLKYYFKYWGGKWRLLLGFCPMCNSDAPELYDCPCCHYYSSGSGDKFPPTKATKINWWETYYSAIIGKMIIDRRVKEYRK